MSAVAEKQAPIEIDEKAAMRMQIAADVIEGIQAKHFSVMEGVYFEFPYDFERQHAAGDSLRAALMLSDMPCDLCAKGALFYAHVMRFNHVSVPERLVTDRGLFDEEVSSPLLNYFSADQLGLIESAFEGDECFARHHPLRSQAVFFGDCYRSPKDRLTAICQNIIDNNGEFRP